MNSGIVIRPLDPAEVDIAIDRAAEEGWNPGLDDAGPFRAVDPEGFLGLFVDGSMAVCISAVAYDESFSFIGFYICRKDFRGRGYGKRLWDAAVARLGSRTIGLDGVVAQQANYAKSGFVLAHRNVRYSGNPSVAKSGRAALVEIGGDAPTRLLDSIVAYDRPLFAGARKDFVRQWIDTSTTRRTIASVEGDAVRGYGTVRPCREGFKIGPLFADDEATADAIFTALACPLRDALITLDAPEPNLAASRLVDRHGLRPVFETARMYRGVAPSLPLARIFGITSFELG